MPSRLRQILALMKKEMLQVFRDPSSILIAFVLPLILLFIFGFGLSLDAKYVRLAVVMLDRSPTAWTLMNTISATDYVAPIFYNNRPDAEQALVDAHVRGVFIIPQQFSQELHSGKQTEIQLLTDGSETNTATILENYIYGIVTTWQTHRANDQAKKISPKIAVKPRVLFNPDQNTRNALIPGSIVLIMGIIGTLLTALVVAREWERGTMEAMLATPITTLDTIVGKILPYYILAMLSMTICVLLSYHLFSVPFRGSVFALFLVSTVFLIVALGQGFFISTITKNQFLASQAALLSAFLPNLILSGAMFEISSMPLPIRTLTYVFPARYYVTSLQTIFMAGDIWPLLLKNIGCMLIIGFVVVTLTVLKTPKRLE